MGLIAKLSEGRASSDSAQMLRNLVSILMDVWPNRLEITFDAICTST